MATTYEDILTLFRETDRKFQESWAKADQRFQETERLLKEQSQETERLLKEQSQETERLLKEQSQETERKFQATDRKLNQLEKLFTSQWGKLMESLVEGDLVALLVQRGIPIADTTTRLKGKRADGGNYEFDIIAHNGEEMVVVEVKTTLKPQDVEDFLERLRQMKHWIPRYAHHRIYGAIAWLTADAGAERMVENRGLFSIRAIGHSASIQNPPDFTPRAW
jgi:hypothetical protein